MDHFDIDTHPLSKKFPWLMFLFSQLYQSEFNDLKVDCYHNACLFDHEKYFKISKSEILKYFTSDEQFHHKLTLLTYYLQLRFDPFHPYVCHEIDGLGRITIIASKLTKSSSKLFLRKKIISSHRLQYIDDNNYLELFDQNFCKYNWLVCGGSGSGKTTLLFGKLTNYFANNPVVFIDRHQERQHTNNHLWTFLRAQPTQLNSQGLITTTNLLELAFKLGSKALVIGEINISDIEVLFNGLFSGHHHFYGTFHASDLNFLCNRLEMYYPKARSLALNNLAAIFLQKSDQGFIIKDIHLPY